MRNFRRTTEPLCSDVPFIPHLDISDVEKIIYEPGLDGNPTRDITALANSLLDPEVKQYILNKLQRPVEGLKGVSDPDLAIELCRGRFESPANYANRMYDVYEQWKKESSDNE